MDSKRNLLQEVRVLMPGRARSHWMLTEAEEPLQIFAPAFYGFWAIRFEDYLQQVTKTKWRFAKKLIVRDGSKIRYKWLGRKAQEEVVAPCFLMLVGYDAGKDLYTIETGYALDGKLQSSKTYTDLYIDQVMDPKVVFGWVKGQWGKGVKVRTEATSGTKRASVAAKKAFVKQAWAKRGAGNLPAIDPDEYPPIKGMEGPFWIKVGGDHRVLYYDPKEGKYYDRKTDVYVDDRVESVAGYPGPFQGDQTFEDWKEEVRQQIRAPSWTYPGWALSKENLAETEGRAAEPDERLSGREYGGWEPIETALARLRKNVVPPPKGE